ncbi:MAG: hypothetical protein AAB265_15030, partial [candidate division NC10 bacterium]
LTGLDIEYARPGGLSYSLNVRLLGELKRALRDDFEYMQSGRLLSQWILTGERPALLATFDPARPSLAASAP